MVVTSGERLRDFNKSAQTFVPLFTFIIGSYMKVRQRRGRRVERCRHFSNIEILDPKCLEVEVTHQNCKLLLWELACEIGLLLQVSTNVRYIILGKRVIV